MATDLTWLADAPGSREAARAVGPDHRLGLRVGDQGVTIRTTSSGIAVDPGLDDARVVVAMDDDAYRALCREESSIFGLLYGGRLQVERGGFQRFAAWEPALQAMLYNRPVFDGSIAERFAGVDLARSFTLDDDTTEMAARLDEFGFLHIRNVFSAEEIAAMSAEVDRLRDESRPDDRLSWWATNADGAEVCCRVTFMAERSPLMASLGSEPRLDRLAALTGLQLRCTIDRIDGISVVIKNSAVVQGLSDLPWHRDCGLGGHPLLCPGVNLGVQLDRADAANGQLWFLPGSHRHAGPLGDPTTAGYPTVAIDAEPGDVTMHYGHVLHAAPPPAGADAGRRAIYVGYSRPELFDVIGAGDAYNNVLYGDGDGRVRHVGERDIA
jgi:ectoine hydroxylase-related dioxygenase (phytanoyl-CoA dioxygenase family)